MKNCFKDLSQSMKLLTITETGKLCKTPTGKARITDIYGAVLNLAAESMGQCF